MPLLEYVSTKVDFIMYQCRTGLKCCVHGRGGGGGGVKMSLQTAYTYSKILKSHACETCKP